jgi:hypothetical protein
MATAIARLDVLLTLTRIRDSTTLPSGMCNFTRGRPVSSCPISMSRSPRSRNGESALNTASLAHQIPANSPLPPTAVFLLSRCEERIQRDVAKPSVLLNVNTHTHGSCRLARQERVKGSRKLSADDV